jgi:hypothetical protein
MTTSLLVQLGFSSQMLRNLKQPHSLLHMQNWDPGNHLRVAAAGSSDHGAQHTVGAQNAAVIIT